MQLSGSESIASDESFASRLEALRRQREETEQFVACALPFISSRPIGPYVSGDWNVKGYPDGNKVKEEWVHGRTCTGGSLQHTLQYNDGNQSRKVGRQVGF